MDQMMLVRCVDGLMTYPCTDHSDAHRGSLVRVGHGVMGKYEMLFLQSSFANQ
jgi:hypothetical protein